MHMSHMMRVVCLGVAFLSGNAHSAKVDPESCPCYESMVEVTNAASCMVFDEYRKQGHGKWGWTKQLMWVDNEACYRLNLSKASARIDSYIGETSGIVTCDYIEGDRCLVSGLTETEITACERVLRNSKRSIQRLPDC